MGRPPTPFPRIGEAKKATGGLETRVSSRYSCSWLEACDSSGNGRRIPDMGLMLTALAVLPLLILGHYGFAGAIIALLLGRVALGRAASWVVS
jgi:hypothetical protein